MQIIELRYCMNKHHIYNLISLEHSCMLIYLPSSSCISSRRALFHDILIAIWVVHYQYREITSVDFNHICISFLLILLSQMLLLFWFDRHISLLHFLSISAKVLWKCFSTLHVWLAQKLLVLESFLSWFF